MVHTIIGFGHNDRLLIELDGPDSLEDSHQFDLSKIQICRGHGSVLWPGAVLVL